MPKHWRARATLTAGLRLIEECLDQIDRPGWHERVWLPEVRRLKGWMLMRQGKLPEAEAQLRASIDWARRQQARSWELRSSTTLAELLAASGKCDSRTRATHANLWVVHRRFRHLRPQGGPLDVGIPTLVSLVTPTSFLETVICIQPPQFSRRSDLLRQRNLTLYDAYAADNERFLLISKSSNVVECTRRTHPAKDRACFFDVVATAGIVRAEHLTKVCTSSAGFVGKRHVVRQTNRLA